MNTDCYLDYCCLILVHLNWTELILMAWTLRLTELNWSDMKLMPWGPDLSFLPWGPDLILKLISVPWRPGLPLQLFLTNLWLEHWTISSVLLGLLYHLHLRGHTAPSPSLRSHYVLPSSFPGRLSCLVCGVYLRGSSYLGCDESPGFTPAWCWSTSKPSRSRSLG